MHTERNKYPKIRYAMIDSTDMFNVLVILLLFSLDVFRLQISMYD